MSISTTNAVGTKISTRIRQAAFNPLDIEAFMYMGQQTVPMFTHAMKKSTWGQVFWKNLSYRFGDCDNELLFGINGIGTESYNTMDYLLALSVELIFPKVTLVNTDPAVPFYTGFFPSSESQQPEVGDIDQRLYYYLSDGTGGLPSQQLYVGTFAALTNSPNGETPGLGIDASLVSAFSSCSPRHRVGWGHHAALAAVSDASFLIDGVDYEELNSHALYNSLEFRTRQDVYPVSVFEATSLPATLLPANIGSCACAVLGDTFDRYKGFVVPHSFTTSALADRGENGKHKSAFPILLACKNLIEEKITVIDDLRKLLVLEEEILSDYSKLPVVFVATSAELGIVEGTPTNDAYYTNGTHIWEVEGFNLFNGVWLTNGNYTVSNMTYNMHHPFRVADFGVKYLNCTGEYHPLTRPTDYTCANPFSEEFDYSSWIKEDKLKLEVRMKALCANVTDLERGMMKADCRSKKWLYERYRYFCDQGVTPGSKVDIEISEVPGQTKYAYTFAQNELSRLQGHYFNYTNNTEYSVYVYEDINRQRWVFDGQDSLERITTRVQGFKDDDHPAMFYRYIDNGLFSQRVPRPQGLHIAPRYANWINSIYPDGSINSYWSDPTVFVKTSPSGLNSQEVSEHYQKCNTYAYNINVIVVAWNIIVFELFNCQTPPPM